MQSSRDLAAGAGGSTSQVVTILDHGRPLRLDHAGLLAYHGGGALAGAALGFQAMACAAEALSRREPWDRRDVTVISWHRGPGVRDAIEFVTRAVTRGRFELRPGPSAGACGGGEAAFRLQVSDRERSLQLSLREGVLPGRFFELAATPQRTPDEESGLMALKAEIAERVMRTPPSALFLVVELEKEPGERGEG